MEYDLFDTHAHYTDQRFETEHEGGAKDILGTVFASGVSKIVNMSVNYENSLEVCEQASKYEGMYAAVGIHPSDCKSFDELDSDMENIESLLRRKEELKIVAVGEIGLDYYWEPYDKKLQEKYFSAQMELALKYNLPVVIHDREAHGDTVAMINRFPTVRGIIHSCSVSAEIAKELCKKGWFVSFSGTVTFKNANKVKQAAKAVPIDKILVETDCPYLAPHPCRGQLNHSGLMHYTAETLAEIHEIPYDEMKKHLYNNAMEVFNLK